MAAEADVRGNGMHRGRIARRYDAGRTVPGAMPDGTMRCYFDANALTTGEANAGDIYFVTSTGDPRRACGQAIRRRPK